MICKNKNNILSFAGIDFSLNHTGIVIEEANEYKYYSFSREPITKRQKELISDIEFTLNYQDIPLLKRTEDDISYSDNEIRKLIDSRTINYKIMEILKERKVETVYIEGLSFTSLSKSSLDIAGYQYLLRRDFINASMNLTIFTPSEIKKTAGKGNFNKYSMFLAYQNNVLKDSKLEKCCVRKKILNNVDAIISTDKKNKKNVIEPICGLIDAYFCLKTGKRI